VVEVGTLRTDTVTNKSVTDSTFTTIEMHSKLTTIDLNGKFTLNYLHHVTASFIHNVYFKNDILL
jgi:hypothetical protein